MRMKIADIRRRRLALAINTLAAGSQAEFARLCDKTPQKVSGMLRGTESFGEKIARDIEKKAGLPAGWLDIDEAGAEDSVPVRAPDELIVELRILSSALVAALATHLPCAAAEAGQALRKQVLNLHQMPFLRDAVAVLDPKNESPKAGREKGAAESSAEKSSSKFAIGKVGQIVDGGLEVQSQTFHVGGGKKRRG